LLESAPSAQELCHRGRSQSIGRDRREQNEYRLALSDVDVLRLVDKAEMPAKRSSLVLRQLSVDQQEREREGFCQADELELQPATVYHGIQGSRRVFLRRIRTAAEDCASRRPQVPR
jgi:hypothetical protein